MGDRLDEQVEIQARRILALEAKAKSASTPEEAAAFAAKAQALLLEYNLDMSKVDEATIKTGRIDEELEGGRFEYQQDLWRAVAQLNFCIYDNVRSIKSSARVNRYVHHHRLVGRRVNVASTIVLARYLEEAIDREVFRLKTSRLRQPDAKWETSFRSGAANAIIIALHERRNQQLSEEQQAEQAEIAEALDGVGTGAGLMISTYMDAETDANIDRMFGDGTAARLAADRQADAESARLAEEKYTKWAAANPERARMAEINRRERELAQQRKENNRFWKKHDLYAWKQGAIVGKTIGLDPQVDDGKKTKLNG